MPSASESDFVKRFLCNALLGSILLFSVSPAVLYAQDFSIPETISPEAQTALAGFSRAAATAPLPAADDLDGWKAVQQKIEQKRAAANAEVVKKYQPEITPRKLGGVPVLDIKPKG